MKKLCLLLPWLMAKAVVFAQPGNINMTPTFDLNLQNVSVEVPSKFSSKISASLTLNLPPGYKVKVFYVGGLTKPRFMSISPQGVLHVSDMASGGNGKVYALPDTNNDGVADTAIIVSQGYTNNHDVKFYKGNMYVTETTKINKCTDSSGDGIYETKASFITGLGGGSSSGHFTRTLVFDSVNHKAYVSVGSSCNVCRESNRALIEQYNDDGTGKRTYADGIRNAVGMTLHPKTNRLWANNNGSDNQGNETPPEWINLIRDGEFYGHPFAYANQVWFNMDTADYPSLKPITLADTTRVQGMKEPAALIRAHSAPMAISFFNESSPAPFRKGFLSALHGSWNTTKPNNFRGYKVIYADLSDDNDTTVNYIADFCSGFITDTVNRIYWGRPCGIAMDNQGSVYISSDETNKCILKIYNDVKPGQEQLKAPAIRTGAAFPVPFNNTLTVPIQLTAAAHVTITVYDMAGRKITVLSDEMMNAGMHTKNFDMHTPEGVYFLHIQGAGETIVKKITCIRD